MYPLFFKDIHVLVYYDLTKMRIHVFIARYPNLEDKRFFSPFCVGNNDRIRVKLLNSVMAEMITNHWL